MKLEAGKSYKTRDGKRVDVVYVHPDDHIPHSVVAKIAGQKRLTLYGLTGLYWDGDVSNLDIIDEWIEPKPVEAWGLVNDDGSLFGISRTREGLIEMRASNQRIVRLTGTYTGEDDPA